MQEIEVMKPIKVATAIMAIVMELFMLLAGYVVAIKIIPFGVTGLILLALCVTASIAYGVIAYKCIKESMIQPTIKVYMNLEKKFVSTLGMEISRSDYEDMPAGMCAILFSDEQMQDLVDDIEYNLVNEDNVTKEEIARYVSLMNKTEFTKEEENEYDDWNEIFFTQIENTAIKHGMKYYEDMSEREYANINNAIKQA